jgi:pimeloyl-ACP methyl ester carboxylesterase
MHGAWTTVDTAGKSVDFYDPPGPARPRLGMLFLHGVGLETLIDKPAFTRLFDELHIGCGCPHGQRAWWTDRVSSDFDPALTAEKHLLGNVVPAMQKRWQLGPRSIGVMGVNMGGQGALRLAFKHPQVFPATAGIAPALDYHEWYGQGYSMDEMYDSKEQCRQDTAIMHVPPYGYPPHIFFCVDPEDSDWFRGNDRLHEKLGALGIPHTCDLATRAGGHSWEYYNAMAERAVRFVHAGLEQESRRLL